MSPSIVELAPEKTTTGELRNAVAGAVEDLPGAGLAIADPLATSSTSASAALTDVPVHVPSVLGRWF